MDLAGAMVSDKPQYPHTPMSAESLNLDELTDERRKSAAETIHPVTVEQLKTLGEGLFPYLDHPWREKFFTFIQENAASTFYHATTLDHVHLVYCPDKDQGMWFLPGSGMGPLQAKGRAIMKELAQGK